MISDIYRCVDTDLIYWCYYFTGGVAVVTAVDARLQVVNVQVTR